MGWIGPLSLVARLQTADLRQQHQQELAAMRADYGRLKQAVDAYHAQLATVMAASG